MLYRVIGIMSGSSLDGLDLAFIEFEETGGKWNFEIIATDCISYNNDWIQKLQKAATASAYDFTLLHSDYGWYIGNCVNEFIDRNDLHHKVQLISSHGHTLFHAPHLKMTTQLGHGAAIAAATQINVVSDLRMMDVAFGGQGAPIVPIGEKLLFNNYSLFLNLGGIANVSLKNGDQYIAFDICAANRVLNMLANNAGKDFDEDGTMAAAGNVFLPLLTRLNALSYYAKPHPKSLDNAFGTGDVMAIIDAFDISNEDKLRTYVEHIVVQIKNSLEKSIVADASQQRQMLVTGGGAFNRFLVDQLSYRLKPIGIEVVVPDKEIVNYKEALIMGLIGVLRWREEYNVLSTVTGATRSSIGGAVWIGQEA